MNRKETNDLLCWGPYHVLDGGVDALVPHGESYASPSGKFIVHHSPPEDADRDIIYIAQITQGQESSAMGMSGLEQRPAGSDAFVTINKAVITHLPLEDA